MGRGPVLVDEGTAQTVRLALARAEHMGMDVARALKEAGVLADEYTKDGNRKDAYAHLAEILHDTSVSALVGRRSGVTPQDVKQAVVDMLRRMAR